MFDDTNLGPEVLKNPALLQNLVLTDYQNRLNGIYVVADPNNSFNIQLEANASIASQIVKYMERGFNAQYAVRATTSSELYNSMSDFDYLNMVASPATTTVKLTFDVNYLISNALSYDVNFNRIVIPEITQFYIGPLTFGLYYPINININKVTNSITVLWDTTTINPLYTLVSNMVPNVQLTYGGLNLITLEIPVFQFILNTTYYPVVAQQGFIQSIPYTDQFYAARIYTNTSSGNWTELKYTLSETVYDPSTPTAKLNIQPDTSTLTVSIPQIYFTNNQIGTQVKVVLYTTKGKVSVDLTSVTLANCNVSFGIGQDSSVTAYTNVLQNMSTINLLPSDTSIKGGTDALSFSQLRNLIINGGLYTSAPVTPAQLNTLLEKNGFTGTKYLDNITDRIYFASNTITGGYNGTILVTNANINVSNNLTCPTIISFTEANAITILPTTLYTYNSSSNICTPLNQTQLNYLNGLTGVSLVNELNTTTYTTCPFHIVTYTDSQYPVTKSYNLLSPTVNYINYISDNVVSAAQMSIVNAAVIHNENGVGGYTIRLGIVKNTSMQAIAESDITVILMSTDSDGNKIYGIATLTSTVTSATSSQSSIMMYIYELNIPSTYYISKLGTIELLMSQGKIDNVPVEVDLTSNFTAVCLVDPSALPNVAQDSNLVVDLPAQYQTLLGISKQQLNISFGTDLSEQIFNITNANWSSTTYMTYPQIVYQTYPQDVYLLNSNGGLEYTITNGVLNLTIVHNKGDQVLDDQGNPVILHNKGDVVLAPNGTPIVAQNGARQLEYYARSMMFDLRIFKSQNQADIQFVNNLTNQLNDYFTTISTIQGNLLEQTALYYLPNSTMGTATFSLGNNVQTILNLGFSFNINVYVVQATLQNATLQTTIKNDIITIIQNEMSNNVISLTDIASSILSTLTESVLSVDVEGIDGNQNLQTVIVPSGTINPIIAQQLVWDETSATMTLQPNITINFKLAQ